MLRRNILGRALLLALGILAPSAAQAQWNLSADWSTVSNPNGAWVLGQRGSLLSTGLSAFWSSTTMYGWASRWDGGDYYPYAGKNMATDTRTASSLGAVPSGQVFMHPTAWGDYTIARWVAPTSGSYVISSLFTGLDRYGTSTDVHVLLDGTALFGAFVDGYQVTQGYDATLALLAGDKLDFAVGYGDNYNYYNDTTGLDVTISNAVVATPEPASLILVTSGLLAVGGVARRRRR